MKEEAHSLKRMREGHKKRKTDALNKLRREGSLREIFGKA